MIDAARLFQAAGRSDVQFVNSGEGERGPRWHAQAAGQGQLDTSAPWPAQPARLYVFTETAMN